MNVIIYTPMTGTKQFRGGLPAAMSAMSFASWTALYRWLNDTFPGHHFEQLPQAYGMPNLQVSKDGWILGHAVETELRE